MKIDAKKVRATMTKRKDKSVVVSADTEIHIPQYFRDKGLFISDKDGTVAVMGSFGIVQGNSYARSMVGCYVTLGRGIVSERTIDDMDYIIISFKAGDVLITSTMSIQRKLEYLDLFTEYLLRGRIPWFLDYEDVIPIFLNGTRYSGLDLEVRPETIELIHSLLEFDVNADGIIRSLQEKNPKRKKIKSVPLDNVHYGASTTLTKITGSYQGAGINSALITKTTKLSAAEKILRDI